MIPNKNLEYENYFGKEDKETKMYHMFYDL